MDEFLRAMAEITNHLPDDKFNAGIHKVRVLVSAENESTGVPPRRRGARRLTVPFPCCCCRC